jgi:phosphatidate cytidylyltransferase
MKNKFIETNEITNETKSSMRTRIITSVVLAAIAIPCLFLGGWFYFALSFIIAVFSAYELVHVIGLKSRFKYLIYTASIILMICFVYWIFIKNNIAAYIKEPSSFDASKILVNEFTDLIVSTVLIMVAAGVFFGISFICEEFTVNHVFYLLSMTIVVGLCLQSSLYLRLSPFERFKDITDTGADLFKYLQSSFLIIYVILGTISTDIGAYFIGVLFGKHKLNPRISPKKTWEGFFGGWFISFILSATFALVLGLINYPALPSLNLNYFYWFLLLSFLMPIFANLGDFAFSAIKRGFGIKDFSNLLPGHGGILDRFDSILFVSGFVAVMLIFINNGWKIFA